MFHQPQCGTIQPMPIDLVLAVVPVSDIQVAQRWYEALVGRPEDNHPMDTLVDWQVTDHGWGQVVLDPERGGSTMLNFAVDDLDRQAAELAARGLALGEIQTANKGVRTASIS